MLPLQVRVDLGAMAMKRHSASSKTPALLQPHHQIGECYIQDTRWREVLLLCRDGRCILQPRLTRLHTYLIHVNLCWFVNNGAFMCRVWCTWGFFWQLWIVGIVGRFWRSISDSFFFLPIYLLSSYLLVEAARKLGMAGKKTRIPLDANFILGFTTVVWNAFLNQ